MLASFSSSYKNLYIHISIQYPPYSPRDAFNCCCYLKLITIIVKTSFVIWLTMITCYQFLIVYHRWIKTLKQEGGGKPHPWQIRVLSKLSVIIVILFCNHFHCSTDNYLQSHCNHHHRYHHSLYSAQAKIFLALWPRNDWHESKKFEGVGGEQGRVTWVTLP